VRLNLQSAIPTTLRRIGPNSLTYAAGDLIARGAAFLLLPLYTRTLTTAEYGTYGVVLSLVAILNVLLPMQLQAGVTVQYFQVGGTQRREFISAALASLLLSNCLIAGFLLATQRWWAFALIGRADPEVLAQLAIGIAALSAFGTIPQSLMRLREQPRMLVTITASTYIVGLGLGVYMLLGLHLGTPGLLGGTLIANALVLPVYAAYLRPEVTRRIPSHWFGDMALISLPLVPHMIAHWGLNLMDRIILQRFVSLSDVGIYQLGYQLGTLFQIVVLGVNAAWVPYLFQRLGNPSAADEMKRTSTWLVYVQAWIGLGIALLVPEAAVLVLAPSFHQAVGVVPWVVLGFFMVALYHLWVNLLFFRKRTALVPVATLIAAFVNLVLNLTLIPRVGYIGAAYTTAISYAVLAALTGLMTKHVGIGPDYEYRKWAIAAAVGIGLFLMGTLLNESTTALRWAGKGVLWLTFPLMLVVLRFVTLGEFRGLAAIFKPNGEKGDHPN